MLSARRKLITLRARPLARVLLSRRTKSSGLVGGGQPNRMCASGGAKVFWPASWTPTGAAGASLHELAIVLVLFGRRASGSAGSR
jgi:hypothetical protein